MNSRSAFRVFFDLSLFLIYVLVFRPLAENWMGLTFKLYLPVYLLYTSGLFFKQYQPDYMNGVHRLGKNYPLIILVLLTLQASVGGLAFGSFQILLDIEHAGGWLTLVNITALCLLVPLSASVMIFLLIKAGEKNRRPLLLSRKCKIFYAFFSDLGLWSMGLVILSFFYNQAEKMTFPFGRNIAGILAAFFVSAVLGFVFYLPVRIHVILENPKDRSNWISFFLTLIFFAAFLVSKGRP
ncbi:MAG: hypothetical protein JXB26_17620 [Candidatus Aminicenantes bacterium]|nr:hypothetical protein [Candidatus Aminicenantes bacterium]